MNMEEIIDFIENLDNVLSLKPQAGDDTPQIAWGDAFFYYSPNGTVPKTQPFATIVTKNYPDDEASHLDRAGVFRVNIAAGTELFTEWIGAKPRETVPDDIDFSVSDVVVPHPVYCGMGWLCVVDPGPESELSVKKLLEAAHRQARDRFNRHSAMKSM